MKKFISFVLLISAWVATLCGCEGSNGGGSSAPNPATPTSLDSWEPMAQNPLWDSTFHPRNFSIVWTGCEMILWGQLTGSTLMTGAVYDPLADNWSAISSANSPGPGPAVWTGEEMIVFTGYETGRYNPTTDTWRFGSNSNQPDMIPQMSIWTGTELIVWGSNFFGQSTGGKYNPSTDTWSAISNMGAPPAYPVGQTAVWTGSLMIVWTGLGGAAYDPTTDVWTPLAGVNAPSSRFNHVAIWTGNEMIVWGGQIQISSFIRPVQSGGLYNPSTDVWSSMSSAESVWAMNGTAAVWSGGEMILWTTDGGAAYDPATDTWRRISNVDAPTANGPGVWTGTGMIVWSGESGGRYTP